VSVLLTVDREMRRLNRQFRGQNKATDVLSFPACNSDHSSANERSKRSRPRGDLAISVEIASQNADRMGHSLEEELKILILHGVLHLAGHDHEVDDGEMAALERKLRQKLRLPGSLIARARRDACPQKIATRRRRP
jgi:probable rRNA maturation factor